MVSNRRQIFALSIARENTIIVSANVTFDWGELLFNVKSQWSQTNFLIGD